MELAWLIFFVPVLAGIGILARFHKTASSALFAAVGAAALISVLLICGRIGMLQGPESVRFFDPKLMGDSNEMTLSLIWNVSTLTLALCLVAGSLLTMIAWRLLLKGPSEDPYLYGLWILATGGGLGEILMKPSLPLLADGLLLACILGGIATRSGDSTTGQRILFQIVLNQVTLLLGLLILPSAGQLGEFLILVSGLTWVGMIPWQLLGKSGGPLALAWYLGVACPMALSYFTKFDSLPVPTGFFEHALTWILTAYGIATLFSIGLGLLFGPQESWAEEQVKPFLGMGRRTLVGLSWWDNWLVDGALIRGTVTTFLIFGEAVRLLQCGSVMVYLFLSLMGGGLLYFELF